jgi:hypothetical protein
MNVMLDQSAIASLTTGDPSTSGQPKTCGALLSAIKLTHIPVTERVGGGVRVVDVFSLTTIRLRHSGW